MKLTHLVFFTSLVISPALFAQSEAGKTMVARGKVVAIDENDTEQQRKLRRRSPVFSNDVVSTGEKSKAQLRMTDGGMIALKENSELQISNYQFSEESGRGSVVMELVKGGLRSVTGAIKAESGDYKLKTPVGSIGIRGTHYEVEIVGSTIWVAVWDGAVDLDITSGESAGSTLSLGSGEGYSYASIDEGGKVTTYVEPPETFQEGMSSEPDDVEQTDEAEEEAAEEEAAQNESNTTEDANPDGNNEATDDSESTDTEQAAENTEEAPVEETPAEEAPTEETPTEEAPSEETPAEQTSEETSGVTPVPQSSSQTEPEPTSDDSSLENSGTDNTQSTIDNTASDTSTESTTESQSSVIAISSIAVTVTVEEDQEFIAAQVDATQNVEVEQSQETAVIEEALNPAVVPEVINEAITDFDEVPDNNILDLLQSREGTFSYNQLASAEITSTSGTVNNFQLSMTIDFDEGTVPGGQMSFDDDAGEWFATFGGVIDLENLDLDITFASHGNNLADGDIDAAFFGDLNTIIGNFTLHEIVNPDINVKGSFEIK